MLQLKLMSEVTDNFTERQDLQFVAEPCYTDDTSLAYDGVVAEGGCENDIEDGLPLSDIEDELSDTSDVPDEPEYVAKTPAQEVVKAMEDLRVKEFLGDAATRDAVRAELDPDAYKQVLNAVNGKARGVLQEKWGMTGSGQITESGSLMGRLKDYDPPQPEDREPLLDKALDVAKDLPAEHSATLKGLVVNATHVYDDGCGRTARWIYVSDTHGYDGSAADRELYERALGETTGREVVNLDQSRMGLPRVFAERQRSEIAAQQDYDGNMPMWMVGGYGAAMGGEEAPEKLDAHPDLSRQGRETLHDVITDQNFGPNAVMWHLLQTGRADQYVSTSVESGRTAINMDNLASHLNDDDVQAIGRLHKGFKRAYVEDLIQIFADPERASEAQAIVDFYRPNL